MLEPILLEVWDWLRGVNKVGGEIIEVWFVMVSAGLPASPVMFESREATDSFAVVSAYFACN